MTPPTGFTRRGCCTGAGWASPAPGAPPISPPGGITRGMPAAPPAPGRGAAPAPAPGVPLPASTAGVPPAPLDEGTPGGATRGAPPTPPSAFGAMGIVGGGTTPDVAVGPGAITGGAVVGVGAGGAATGATPPSTGPAVGFCTVVSGVGVGGVGGVGGTGDTVACTETDGVRVPIGTIDGMTGG